MPPAVRSLLERPGVDRCRLVVGLDYSRASRCLRSVLLAGLGNGFDTQVEIVTSQKHRIPGRLARAMRHVRRTKAGIAALLAAELAEFGATAVGELLASRPQLERRVSAIGVTEPGAWGRSRGGLVAYLPLVDAGRLAALTGQNVIDAFPARDLAQEGAGGPLDPLCDWLLMHDGSKTRVLVDLGRDVRLSFLPPTRDPAGVDRVVSWTITPGLSLLNRLASAAGSQKRFDDGGHLAVQGQCLAGLLEHWQAEGGLKTLPGPRWQTASSPKKMFASAMALAPAAGWTVTDLLCTAHHLLAREIVTAIRERLPSSVAIDEIVASGGGQHNGFLIHLLAQQLAGLDRRGAESRSTAGVPLVPESTLGVPTGMRGAAVAAVLALLHLDQTPACPTAISGARTPRVLGQLTPGSPQAWQRLLREITAHQPAVVSLRSAI